MQEYKLNDFNYFIDDLPFWSAPFGFRLLECLEFKKNAAVLDIGCGEGFPIVEIAARFGKTGRFLGIDPLRNPLKRFKLKKRQYDLPTAWAIQAVSEELPFASGTFDSIVSNNGLNNVSDLNRCLEECRRVIHKSGQMVFTVNTEDTMKEFYAVFTQVLEGSSPGISMKVKEQIRQKRLSEEQWREKLSNAGFKIHTVTRDRFALFFADGTTMLDYYLIKKFFLPGWQALVEDGKRNDVFSGVETRLNEIARDSGRLEMTIPFMVFDCRPAQDHTE